MPEQTQLPLSGIRILDFTQNLPGPYASFLLQEQGASIIKIEPPRGDPARKMPGLFHLVNAGKKCILVDLTTPEGVAEIHRILPHTDIIIEGFRPGVMAQFGLSAETLTHTYPHLIYCSITGYGQTGPMRDFPGHDLNYQAITGVCCLEAGLRGKPAGTALPIADFSGAMEAVNKILCAVIQKNNTGKGSIIDVALTDALSDWTQIWGEGVGVTENDIAGVVNRKISRAKTQVKGSLLTYILNRLPQRPELVYAGIKWLMRHGPVSRFNQSRLYTLPHYRLYRAKCGQYLALGIVDEQKFWKAFCNSAGLSRYSSLALWQRVIRSSSVHRAINKTFKKKTRSQWLAILDQNQIPVTPVLSANEARNHPQLRHRHDPLYNKREK